ncbi:putative secreted protein [Streptosporangium album]|uniref:Putative secreted protein n=1 Tax=Streptosporangium album TaxID=47479 RepID=A0A7W7S540_9ACTN|nr:protease inhibitor I42 family protein [Streptosporangium album]MBB4944058.1 putative secreted protein [Streptosporangium album]
MIHRTTMVVLLLVALVAGCGNGAAVQSLGVMVHGKVGATVDVRLTPGQRFSLGVDENASAGDSWRMADLPDVKVASFISEEYRPGSEAKDAGGVRYFVFNAKRPGTATVTISNCRSCPANGVSADEQSRRASGDATFRITVT